jgi:hypothetical protein
VPADAKLFADDLKPRLEEWISAAGDKAVGLVGGLDLSDGGPDEEQREQQRKAFGIVLELCKTLSKPLMLLSLNADKARGPVRHSHQIFQYRNKLFYCTSIGMRILIFIIIFLQ